MPGAVRRARRVAAILATGGLGLAACQGLPPAVTTALVGFGQDMLAAAAHNFAPQYASSVQNLLFAMAETATGAPFTQQAYVENQSHGGTHHHGGHYDTGPGPYADGSYDQGEYLQQHGSQDSYHESYYGQGDYDQGDYDESSYGQSGVAQAAQAQPPSYTQQPGAYAHQGSERARRGPGLEVALLAQQRTHDGQVRLRPVNDGDVLRDGRGDPAQGDKIKIFFSADCACYVYVIGIDATGYVAQIFPEGDFRAAGRVLPGQKFLLPEGTTWWGLDETRGIEHIYFIASRERRPDIEDLVVQLAGQRPSLPADYRAVREPAVVAMTRGLVQVQSAAPTVVPTEYGASQQFSPTLFQATVEDADLVITRWFRHE